MSIKAYNVCERGKKKLKVLDTLVGTQPRRNLDKLRSKGYIIKKIYK